MLFDTIAVPPFWTDFQVKLDSIPLNSPIHVVFRHYATNQYILGLDNINVITGDLTSTNDLYSETFTVYPNPSNGIFVIELGVIEKYDVTVYNVLGQTVFSTFTNTMLTTIDLSSFDKGVYTVELKDKNASYIEKVIVE